MFAPVPRCTARRTALTRCFAAALFALGSLGAAPSHAAENAPGAVARLAYVQGDTALAARNAPLAPAPLNRPVVAGDVLNTASSGRAELDLGSARLRLNYQTTATLQSLGGEETEIAISRGSLHLQVQPGPGPRYAVSTDRFTFVANGEGSYRLDLDTRGNVTLSVLDGGGTLYAEGGSSYIVSAPLAYQISRSGLRDVRKQILPAADGFAAFIRARDARSQGLASSYVSADVLGVDELDNFGDWQQLRDYGPVWFPRQVRGDWAPYRDGSWQWIAPWGWTWVDDAPWGFAPSHYGRWVYAQRRWGWCPGPRELSGVYAPAFVTFYGAGGLTVTLDSGTRPSSWAPLSPFDIYYPAYWNGDDYFNQVNWHNSRALRGRTLPAWPGGNPDYRDRGYGQTGSLPPNNRNGGNGYGGVWRESPRNDRGERNGWNGRNDRDGGNNHNHRDGDANRNDRNRGRTPEPSYRIPRTERPEIMQQEPLIPPRSNSNGSNSSNNGGGSGFGGPRGGGGGSFGGSRDTPPPRSPESPRAVPPPKQETPRSEAPRPSAPPPRSNEERNDRREERESRRHKPREVIE